MKALETFLSHLRDQGIRLWLEDEGRLRVRAPQGTLTPELREELLGRKPEIISFLKALRTDSDSGRPPIRPLSEKKDVPLSFAQQRLWFIDRQEERSVAYNEQIAFELSGLPDVPALERSLAEIVRRHESLRTGFSTRDGMPVQVILPSLHIPMAASDLRKLSGDGQSAEFRRLAAEEARKPFDLKKPPLLRVLLVKKGETSHILLLTIHHIVTDDWSMDIFMRELSGLYRAFSQGLPSPLPELPVQYADFAYWQRERMTGDLPKNLLAYWKGQLAGAPELLELPTDRPRPMRQTFRGAAECFEINKERTRELRELGRKSEATLFMVLLSAFAALLSRHSTQEDVLIGSPMAGRDTEETEALIGFFVNTLVLRTDLSGNPKFGELLKQVRRVASEAYEHHELPFEKLVEALRPTRNPSHTPLIQTAFVWQESPLKKVELPGLTITPLKTESQHAKFDLVLYMEPGEHGLRATFEYNRDLFDAATIRRMWEHFETLLAVMIERPEQGIRTVPLFQKEIAESLGIPASRVEKLSPLTHTQRDLHLDHMINPDHTISALGLSLDLGKNLDGKLWEKAVSIVCGQEDVANTRFCLYHDEPYQFVDREIPVSFEFADFSEETPPASPSRGELPHDFCDISGFIRNWIKTKYDLFRSPLFRNLLIRDPEGNFMAVLAAPRILVDVRSGKVFFERVGAVYEKLCSRGGEEDRHLAGREASLPAFPREAWEREENRRDVSSFYDHVGDCLGSFDTKEIHEYWQKAFSEIAPLVFHTGFDKASKSISKTAKIAGDSLSELKAFCEKHRCGLTDCFRAIYGILLNRYFEAEEDFIIYELIDSRPESYRQTIGCFDQIFPLIFRRKRFRPDASLTDCFEYAKNHRKNIGYLQNISVSLQRALLKEEQLRFFYHFANVGIDTPRAPFNGGIEGDRTNETPLLNLSIHDSFPDNEVHFIIHEEADVLNLSLHYDEKLFSDLDFLDRVLLLSRQIVRGASDFCRLDILMEDERHKLLVEWNDTHTDFPKDKCVHHLFEEQAAKNPDAVALVFGDKQLTYRELNIRANQLAHHLQSMGVGPEVLVGICVERSLEMIIGLLGILKAGGAYVPLDPAYPKERLRFMLEDSQVPVLLAQEKLLPKLPECEADLVCLDRDWHMISQNGEQNPPSDVTARNLVYVIYTSGSTGRPKGVLIAHMGLLNLIFWHQSVFEITSSDRATQLAGISFDASVWEIWPYLTIGSELHLLAPLYYDSLEHLKDWLLSNEITIAFLPTPLAERLLSSPWPRKTKLRIMLTGGDKLCGYPPPSLPFELVNNYGPTENSVVATSGLISNDLSYAMPPTIGRPISNIQLHIADKHLQPVPFGIAGELHIAGAGLSRAYLNRPELTAEKFIPNPFGENPGERLYKTGDLVRYLPDGNIEFLGRIDHQVKIRGFRIELGEIEANLAKHPDVGEAVVVVRDEPSGDKRVIAYVVPKENQTLFSDALRAFLKKHLPEHMIPSAFVRLDKMPLTPNGKTDRRSLPEPDARDSLEDVFIAPRTLTEMRLAKIWEEVLNIRPVGVKDNFFHIGGHSLLAVRLLSHVQKEFGRHLPLSIFFQTPTIEHLADILRVEDEEDERRDWSPLVPIRSDGSKPPLFCVPGSGGNVVCFHELARHLGTDQPFFAFQSRGLDGDSAPYVTVEDMAIRHIKEIRTVQPEGPYHLCGHSFGAYVAFEMACRLQEQGETAATLAILDIPAILPRERIVEPDWNEAKWFALIVQIMEGLYGKDLGISYDELTSLEPEDRLGLLKNRMERADLLPPGSGMKQVRGIVQVIRANERAFMRYNPGSGCSSPISLFRTKHIFPDDIGVMCQDADDPAWGWSQLSTEPVDVRHIPGDHVSILAVPHVRVLAQHLEEVLGAGC